MTRKSKHIAVFHDLSVPPFSSGARHVTTDGANICHDYPLLRCPGISATVEIAVIRSGSQTIQTEYDFSVFEIRSDAGMRH
jgi:hypothetical protein